MIKTLVNYLMLVFGVTPQEGVTLGELAPALVPGQGIQATTDSAEAEPTEAEPTLHAAAAHVVADPGVLAIQVAQALGLGRFDTHR